MFHVLCVLVALLTAAPTRLGAGLQRYTCHFRLEGCLARKYAPSSSAQVGAVKIKSNGTHQQLYVLLTKARISTIGAAGLGAEKARFNTLDQRSGLHGCGIWIHLDHPLGMTHTMSPFQSSWA